MRSIGLQLVLVCWFLNTWEVWEHVTTSAENGRVPGRGHLSTCKGCIRAGDTLGPPAYYKRVSSSEHPQTRTSLRGDDAAPCLFDVRALFSCVVEVCAGLHGTAVGRMGIVLALEWDWADLLVSCECDRTMHASCERHCCFSCSGQLHQR